MLAALKRKLTQEEKGLTLVELLAVIVILGIIAAIAVPSIGNLIGDTKSDARLATARQIYEASRLYIIANENGDFGDKSVTLNTLQTNDFLPDVLKDPVDKKELGPTTVVKYTSGSLDYVTLFDKPATGNSVTEIEKYEETDVLE